MLVDVVVAVTADVVTAVDHERGHAQLLGAPLRQHGAREAGADLVRVRVRVGLGLGIGIGLGLGSGLGLGLERPAPTISRSYLR